MANDSNLDTLDRFSKWSPRSLGKQKLWLLDPGGAKVLDLLQDVGTDRISPS